MKKIILALLLVSTAIAYDIELFVPQFGEDQAYGGIFGSDAQLQSFWSRILTIAPTPPIPSLLITGFTAEDEFVQETHHSLLFVLVCCSLGVAAVILSKKKVGGEILDGNTTETEDGSEEDSGEANKESGYKMERESSEEGYY